MRYLLVFDRRKEKGGFDTLLVNGQYDSIHNVESQKFTPNPNPLKSAIWIEVMKCSIRNTAQDPANHIPIYATKPKEGRA